MTGHKLQIKCSVPALRCVTQRQMDFISKLPSPSLCLKRHNLNDQKAIKDVKDKKAPGKDDITVEMIKALDHCAIPIVHRLVINIYKSSYIPKEVNESIIVTLPKKPRATMCTEYRTLNMMSHLLKMILRSILMRNRQKIENEIGELQSRFMAGKGTREGIFNLRVICECYSKVNQDVYACFIDYEKAFDQVNHEKILSALMILEYLERISR